MGRKKNETVETAVETKVEAQAEAPVETKVETKKADHSRIIENLNAIKAEVDSLVISYNTLISDEDASAKDIKELDTKIQDKVADYNKAKKNLTFLECGDTEAPLLEACRRYTYQKLAIADITEEGVIDDIKTRTVKFNDAVIDLLDLSRRIGKIGADKKWQDYAADLNALMAFQLAKDLGRDPKEVLGNTKMDRLVKETAFGKDPLSNKNKNRTMEKLIQAMIGTEYHANIHAVNFLYAIYAQEDRKRSGTVKLPGKKKFVQKLASICNVIILGKRFDMVDEENK